MKIALFGASGRTGRLAAECLLENGYRITALIRNPDSLPASVLYHPGFQAVQGNVLKKEDLAQVIDNSTSLVYSALSTDKSDTLSTAVPSIIEEMKRKGVRRFVSIGTAGILQARSEPEKLRFQSRESKRKMTRAAEDHAAAFRSLENSDLEWTIFCPTYLPEGPAHAEILWEKDFLPEGGSRITTGSTAAFTCSHLWTEDFYYKRIGLVEAAE